jgi:hypothetical protein
VAPEIPQNEERSASAQREVSAAELPLLVERLYGLPNVFRVDTVRSGGNFRVTAHFAIMDLPLQLAAVSASIEKIVTGVTGARSSS